MGITGNISIAQTRISTDSPVYDNLKDASTAAERAAELTNQMLAYSGRGQFVVKAINLSSLLEEMAQLLKVAISENVSLELDLSEDLPSVKADSTQISQVIMNLLTNAVDAVGEASGTVMIKTGEITPAPDELRKYFFGEDLPEGKYVFMEITDPGVGMDRETVEKAFDPFYTTKETGRGLGLSAVMGIIRGHRGAIRVESEPGKGSTFKVILPASEAKAEIMSSESVEVEGYSGSGTVLVVDDDETVRDVAGAILQQYGFDVLVASDGAEALKIFGEKSTEIALVLMDITMPVMGGLEALPRLREIQDDIKIILSSGYTEEFTVTSAGESVDFIQKPYRLEELIQKVKQVLESTDDV